jgi:hypothetical protein
LDSDGWLLDTYPHSWYLIFRDTGGKPAFLTVMMENDCVPGDDMFTQDMLNRIGESGSADENTPNLQIGMIENNTANKMNATFAEYTGEKTKIVNVKANETLSRRVV